MAAQNPSLATRGQRVGLRLLQRATHLPGMDNPAVRRGVEKALYTSSKHGFRLADEASRRVFAARKGSGDPTRVAPTSSRGVFDLTPTEDQQMLRDAAAELADEVIRPAGARADTDRAVPDEVLAAAAEMGLALVGLPGELGGIAEERSAVSTCLVLEQLARGDLGITTALMAPAAVAGVLAADGSSSQQATYLPAFTGEDGDDRAPRAALALLEPGAVADVTRPRTVGRTRGSDLVLRGTKALVPGAADADLFVVSARVDGAPRLVIVEASAAGLRVEDDPAMGIRAARTGRLHLEGVTVPAANLLGTTGDHHDTVRRARLAWAAAAVGTGQAVLDHVSEYVKQRKAFGEPIAQRQAVAFMVADIALELDAIRLVVLKAAARLDAGRDAAQEIAHARTLVARHGAVIGSNAVQLLGGHGFVKEFDNERWYRDLRGAGVIEGVLYA
jgi:alkylation response protein AidB-like acyl-CoA dehydrogenase